MNDDFKNSTLALPLLILIVFALFWGAIFVYVADGATDMFFKIIEAIGSIGTLGAFIWAILSSQQHSKQWNEQNRLQIKTRLESDRIKAVAEYIDLIYEFFHLMFESRTRLKDLMQNVNLNSLPFHQYRQELENKLEIITFKNLAMKEKINILFNNDKEIDNSLIKISETFAKALLIITTANTTSPKIDFSFFDSTNKVNGYFEVTSDAKKKLQNRIKKIMH